MKKPFIIKYEDVHPKPQWLKDIQSPGKPKDDIYIVWMTPKRKFGFLCLVTAALTLPLFIALGLSLL